MYGQNSNVLHLFLHDDFSNGQMCKSIHIPCVCQLVSGLTFCQVDVPELQEWFIGINIQPFPSHSFLDNKTMDFGFRSLTRLSISSIVIAILLSSFTFTCTEAYDARDPNGNITIKWDVLSWTPDGYVAVVTMYNFQHYRRISPPGWTLGWTWAKKEVIWSIFGSRTTKQGDCSKFKGARPHCCKKTPTVVDLKSGTPYNQQIANCCKGGVINSWAKDPNNYASSFQLSVGAAGTTNKTVKLPKNFTLLAPGPGYICGPAVVGKRTKFITPDGRRMTQAMMTWNVICKR